MGFVLSRVWFVRSEAWYSSLDRYFASPVATADSVAPADFGRHPKAPPGREKGRDDRPRPHSPGWPCPWRYSQPLQRTIPPRATVNGASSTAKAGWPFGSPGPLAGRCCARGFPPGRGARSAGRPRGLLHSTGCPPPAAGRVPLCGQAVPCKYAVLIPRIGSVDGAMTGLHGQACHVHGRGNAGNAPLDSFGRQRC